MAAFVSQPHVVEFLDVVMHQAQVEFRLEEITITSDSPLVGATLADAAIRERTGALVLALREGDATFILKPSPTSELRAGHVLIAIGNRDELEALATMSVAGDPRRDGHSPTNELR